MFMVFQLLQPNVAVVVFVLLHMFYSSFLCCSAGGAWLAGGIVDGSIRGERMGVLRSREDGACSSRTWGGVKADAVGRGDGLRGRAGGSRGAGKTSTEEKRGSSVGLR